MSDTITLTGYLGRDRTIRDTRPRTRTVMIYDPAFHTEVPRTFTRTSEYAVLSLATHEGRETTWHRLIAFDLDTFSSLRLARKGDRVRVTGRRETFRGIDQVVVESFELLRIKPREHFA